jgi:hypothetical protein
MSEIPPPPPPPAAKGSAWSPPSPVPFPPPPPQSNRGGSWTPPSPNVAMPQAPRSQVPRQPMSRNTRLALVGVAAAAVIGALGCWAYNYMNRAPGKAAVRQALDARLKQPGQQLVNVSTKIVTVTTSPNHAAVLAFTATAESTEAHYVPVPVDQYLRQQSVDLQVYRKISNILNGRGGARIRELAGITDPPQDIHTVTLLKQTVASGERNTYTGKIRAVRQSGQWQLVVIEGPFAEKATPAGRLLADYGNNALALDVPDQAQKVANLISAATDTLQKLQQAQQQYRAEGSTPVQVPVSTAATTAGSISGTWSECEGQHCGQWVWNDQAQEFDAVWTGGAKGTIKVKQNDGSRVVLSRVDQDGVSAGLTANYEGTITGNTIEGTVTWYWQIFDGGQAHGTWKATIQR